MFISGCLTFNKLYSWARNLALLEWPDPCTVQRPHFALVFGNVGICELSSLMLKMHWIHSTFVTFPLSIPWWRCPYHRTTEIPDYDHKPPAWNIPPPPLLSLLSILYSSSFLGNLRGEDGYPERAGGGLWWWWWRHLVAPLFLYFVPIWTWRKWW